MRFERSTDIHIYGKEYPRLMRNDEEPFALLGSEECEVSIFFHEKSLPLLRKIIAHLEAVEVEPDPVVDPFRANEAP